MLKAPLLQRHGVYKRLWLTAAQLRGDLRRSEAGSSAKSSPGETVCWRVSGSEDQGGHVQAEGCSMNGKGGPIQRPVVSAPGRCFIRKY